MFVSSANIIGTKIFYLICKVIHINKKESGPSMEPCGTPYISKV